MDDGQILVIIQHHLDHINRSNHLIWLISTTNHFLPCVWTIEDTQAPVFDWWRVTQLPSTGKNPRTPKTKDVLSLQTCNFWVISPRVVPWNTDLFWVISPELHPIKKSQQLRQKILSSHTTELNPVHPQTYKSQWRFTISTWVFVNVGEVENPEIFSAFQKYRNQTLMQLVPINYLLGRSGEVIYICIYYTPKREKKKETTGNEKKWEDVSFGPCFWLELASQEE